MTDADNLQHDHDPKRFRFAELGDSHKCACGETGDLNWAIAHKVENNEWNEDGPELGAED